MSLIIQRKEKLRVKLQDVRNATNNFSRAQYIGGGGFGEVYQGKLAVDQLGETAVAIKRLNPALGQGEREFFNEINLLSHYRHRNIVSLLGFCVDSKERILVYEYVSKKGLDLYLEADDLTWSQRLTICIGAACGLAHLHSGGGTNQRVIHRDVKSANILLDQDWNAKIADFGLSKMGSTDKGFSAVYTTAVGTVGYCDPLYVQTQILTKESDVYSFGVVLFEVLCGRPCILDNKKPGEALYNLVEKYYGTPELNYIIFDKLRNKITPESMKAFTEIAYQCLRLDHHQRPSMEEVVKALQNALDYQLYPDNAYNEKTIHAQTNIDLPRILNGVHGLDSSNIEVDEVNDLIKLLPTSQEMELLKNYKGDEKMLGKRGQFVLECMKIPRIETKLRVFAFTIKFSSQVQKITKYLNMINEANKEIKESKKLESIMMEYDELLARTQKGHLAGRWLNNIQFPKDIFLLYKEAEEKRKDWFDFHKDLIHLDAASKIQIRNLRNSKKAILKAVEKSQQELNASANDGIVSAGFRKALKTFLDSTDHPSLTYFFDDVNHDADSIVTYFRADPVHQSWTKVLRSLGQFIETFKKQDDVLTQERAEMQEAERKRQEIVDYIRREEELAERIRREEELAERGRQDRIRREEELAERERQDRIRREEEFAAEPKALRVFVMMALAIEKTFDLSFKSR